MYAESHGAVVQVVFVLSEEILSSVALIFLAAFDILILKFKDLI